MWRLAEVWHDDRIFKIFKKIPVNPGQLSLVGGAMGNIESRHTARCISPVVWQSKLASGWGIRKRRSVPPYGLYGSRGTLHFSLNPDYPPPQKKPRNCEKPQTGNTCYGIPWYVAVWHQRCNDDDDVDDDERCCHSNPAALRHCDVSLQWHWHLVRCIRLTAPQSSVPCVDLLYTTFRLLPPSK